MSFHLRRKDKEITDSGTLRKILKSTSYVTIAMCKDNQPYLASLSHGYDEEHNCLYFHCASEGKKLDYLVTSNKVWGQALLDYGTRSTESGCTHIYASVHFGGRVTFLDDVKEKRYAMECMISQLRNDPKPPMAKLDNEQLNKITIGRIDIERMTGKKPKEVTI